MPAARLTRYYPRGGAEELETKFKDCLAGGTGIGNLPKDEKWCIYMNYRHEQGAEELIEQLCQTEEGIMRAENAVRKINRDYIQYARDVAEMKNNIDRQLDMERAERVGLAKGRTEGNVEKALEIARKMKAARRPLGEIMEFTGLTAEDIAKL